MRPRLWLIAGPNGAGKSTVAQAESIARLMPGVAIWNPDLVAREFLRMWGFSGFAETPVERFSWRLR